jgi:uncharacterized membrane protein
LGNELKYLRLVILAVVGLSFQLAKAEPDFLDVINKKYGIVDSSMLGAKSCAMCHVSDEDYGFNPYGKQLAQYMTEHNSKVVDDAILAAIGGLDADSDGVSNDDEFKAGSDPAKSDKPGAPETPVVATPQPPKPLIPKNGYHPAIVHFPIALLIAGLLLDLIGLITKRSNLLIAGWYNLVLGAITSVGALASGFLAMTLMKLPYKGLIYTHLKLAVAVTVLMWLMVLLRVHRHEKMNIGARVIYYGLALAAFLIISYTGHLGGVFVYGE